MLMGAPDKTFTLREAVGDGFLLDLATGAIVPVNESAAAILGKLWSGGREVRLDEAEARFAQGLLSLGWLVETPGLEPNEKK